MEWFRWYAGTATDAKWQLVAHDSGQPVMAVLAVWAHVLERANANGGTLDGWNSRVVAVAIGTTADAVTAILDAMQGLVLDGNSVAKWPDRQPKRRDDDSTDRVRAHRERKRDVTRCNAAERTETPEEKRVEEKIEEERANALLSPDEPTTTEPQAPSAEQSAFDAYNAMAGRVGIPLAQNFSPTRKAKIRQRLQECGGLSGWVAALDKLAASSHCAGSNDRGWQADLDFLLQAQSFTRLMEGRYDDRKPQPSRHQPQSRVASDAEVRRRLVAAVYGNMDDAEPRAGHGG